VSDTGSAHWASSIVICSFLLFLLAIVFSVLRFTDSDYLFGIFWPLCFLSFGLRILITPLVSLAIAFSVLLRFTNSDYAFGIFWPLCCLSFFCLRILITPLVSFGHYIVCPSVYGFWWHLWYLLAIVLSVLRFTDSDYTFGIFWPLCFLSFFGLRILITPLVSFSHCVFCPSSVYGFWLPPFGILKLFL
jgi:hypothetical protein